MFVSYLFLEYTIWRAANKIQLLTLIYFLLDNIFDFIFMYVNI